MQESMVHRIAAVTRGRNKGFQIGSSAALANEIGQPFGAQCHIPAFPRFAADQTIIFGHHALTPFLAAKLLQRSRNQSRQIVIIRAFTARPANGRMRLGAAISQIFQCRHRITGNRPG